MMENMTRWEIRYWIKADLSGPPQSESFATPEEARSRREEVMDKGHPTHLRLFPSSQPRPIANRSSP